MDVAATGLAVVSWSVVGCVGGAVVVGRVVVVVGSAVVVVGSAVVVVVVVLSDVLAVDDVAAVVEALADVVSDENDWHEPHCCRKRLKSDAQFSSPSACRTALVDRMHSHAVQTSSSFLVLK